MRAKKHAFWIVPVFTAAITGLGWWVQSVNATQDDVIQLKTIVPRIETQLTDISEKQDTMNDGIVDIKERVSKMEGRLSK